MESIILGTVTLINIVLWIFFFRQLKTKYSDNHLKELRKEVNLLVTDIDRATDRDIALLENRINSLRELIDEAEKKITLAKTVDEGRKKEKEILDELTEKTYQPKNKIIISRQNPVSRAAQMYSQNSMPSILEERPENKNAKEEKPAVFVNFSPDVGEDYFTPPSSLPSENKEQSLKARILHMANEGFSSDMIADQLHVSMTEVNMIIDMFGRF